MDPAAALPNLYLSLCLYVSIYFLTLSSSSPYHKLTSPLLIAAGTDPHSFDPTDNLDRRIKSHSEQLDPFLAAARKAAASKKRRQERASRQSRSQSSVSRAGGGRGSRGKAHHHHQEYHQGYYISSNNLIRNKNQRGTRDLKSIFANRRRQRHHSQQLSQQYHHQQHQHSLYLHLQHQQPQQLDLHHHHQEHSSSPQSSYIHNRYQRQQRSNNNIHSAHFQQAQPAQQQPPPQHKGNHLSNSTTHYPQLHFDDHTLHQQHRHSTKSNPMTDRPLSMNGSNHSATTTTHNRKRDSQGSSSAGGASGDGRRAMGYSTTSNGTMRNEIQKCPLDDAVSQTTLLAHLRLLRAFQSLLIIEDEDLDFLFLIRSEERYLMYLELLQELQPDPAQVPLPPLDVALMWTVHMLAPFRYYEDLLRCFGPMMEKYSLPLVRYVQAINVENPRTDHEAFNPAKEMWKQLYPHEKFDLAKDDLSHLFEIVCLWCGSTNVMDSPTFIKFRIDGIAIDCASCGSQCGLESLSSKRLWEGIKAYRLAPASDEFLAGSILSLWTGLPDPIAAQREHHHLFFHPRIQFGLEQSLVSEQCTWPKVIEAFRDLGPDQYYEIRSTTIARVVSSYMGIIDDRLSLDLVAGALRQRDFQKAMMETGGQNWCQPQVLNRSLDRYKKFMLLSRAEVSGGQGNSSRASHVGGGGGQEGSGTNVVAGGGRAVDGHWGWGVAGTHALVPTLDIDLAWHTHMLSPLHYRQYQLLHYGRVLNHDDTVQATSAMTRQDFVATAKIWQELYQETYSSQQIHQRRFKITPAKICAGVVLFPYGVYLLGRKWKETRREKVYQKQVRKRLEEQQFMQAQLAAQQNAATAAAAAAAAAAQSSGNTRTSTSSEKPTEQPPRPSTLSMAKDKEAEGHELHDLDSGAGATPSSSHNNASSLTVSPYGNNNQPTTNASTVGLDGRLSNWNGQIAGPDGQASCAAGACIMSPWNELQDVVPYIELPPREPLRSSGSQGGAK